MESKKGVSVIVPVSRSANSFVEQALRSICISVAGLSGEKELLFSLDSDVEESALLTGLRFEYPFIRLVKNSGLHGMRSTRMQAIRAARFDVLIFTDDDCLVEADWARRLFELVLEHGVVSGPVQPIAVDTVYAKLEALIDCYRAEAKTKQGQPKFVSFPNLGLQRKLLPHVPFDEVAELYGNDMDLGCRIRVKGTPIFIAQDLVVRTEYPKTLLPVLKRKLKHAEGIAYVQRRMGPERWRELEIGSHGVILVRWFLLSLRASLPVAEKAIFLLMNMTYSLGLIWFFRGEFRSVKPVDEEAL